MMLNIQNSIEEVNVTQSTDVVKLINGAERPLVLRGLVSDWPAVQASRESSKHADQYIRQFYQGAPVTTLKGKAEIAGRFFYNSDLTGFNFERQRMLLDDVLKTLSLYQKNTRPPALYVGSTSLDLCLPGFRDHNDLTLDITDPLVSLWVGNQTRIAAHYDVPDNLACVVTGKRRFIVFPPEQIHNLYIGPLDFTPAGQSISLVDFHQPDYEQFPRFQRALQNAQVTDLEAGDAIYIPSMWWHHVEGLEHLNILINYWWRSVPAYIGTPTDVLLHGLMNIRSLPPAQRKVWESMFNHYLFNSDERTVDHIPEKARGVLSTMDDTCARKIRATLLNKLNR